MNARVISIADQFSQFPAGRFKTDGPHAGEICRRKLLVPALKAGEHVIVEMDGTMGYGSSFLEEAFGGLVREEGFAAADLKKNLEVKSRDPSLVAEVWTYIADAAEQPSES